ncbi:hypothetical protein [Micromonospora aurantiaca (nom. illeg.)]|uniref:hypothetical protein n=1 Tax=Micromonospora aurantiaca (nom. illeg.) TaxID=47850 RepID=UPI0033DEBE4D
MRVTQTHGMGVDSAAWLSGVLRGELPFGHDLADLTVVTAMVGDESAATAAAMTAHMLPLMRAHGVRYVQVARASMRDEDGIVVLSDTHPSDPSRRPDPYRMVMRGAVALSEELYAAGTIPQLASRTCSHKWKGWVLDRWAEQEYDGAPRRHVVGFAAEETRRRDRDEGYSLASPGKQPWYPLIEAGWDRERCLAELRRWYGIEWPRSCCGFCPYQAGPDIARMIHRWSAEPAQVRAAVSLERNARAINPRMMLFGDRSAEQVARRAGLGDAVAQAAADLDARPAELYEVRRIYRRRGDRRDSTGRSWVLGPDPADKGRDVWRSLRAIAAGSRAEMLELLAAQQATRGGTIETVDGAPRLVLQRAAPPYPATEFYLAVAVAGATKQRPAFDELWRWVHHLDLPRQLDALGAR